MTDPRYTDPRYRDPPLDAGLRRGRSSAAMWGWIAALIVIVLIAIVLAAGWDGNTDIAGNRPSATVGSGLVTEPAPATTGQRGNVMVPSTPAPASPSTK